MPSPAAYNPGGQAREVAPASDRLASLESLLTEDNARAYRRFLDWSVGAGFKLAVVEVADPRRRDALVAWTSATVPGTRTLRLDAANREPLRDLLERAASPPGEMAALVLTHLEEAPDRRRVCAQLNVQRDELVRAFAVPWVVVVHPNAALDMQRDAPDFSDFAGMWLPDGTKAMPDTLWRPMSERPFADVPYTIQGSDTPGSRLLTQAYAATQAARYDVARDLLAQHGIAHPEARGSVDRVLIEGMLLWATGRFREAHGRFLDALHSCEKNGDEFGAATALLAVGRVILAQGDLPGARGALERSYALLVKVLGTEEHPSVAASLQALGGVLEAQGDLTGARTLLERSHALLVKVLGTEEHPSVAASLHALAGVLEAQGDLAGARRALERSLAIWVKVLGTEEHRYVASSLYALGSVLHDQGDLTSARRVIERSLDIKARVLGTEEHADVAASLHALGMVLRAQGDLGGARKALERSLDIEAKVRGTEEHREVSACLHALGGVLRAQGDLAGARMAMERSLAILTKVLGTEEHPDVATTYDGLASVLAGEGRTEQAVAACRRALAIRDKCYGTRDHYMSAETEFALAMLLFQLSRAEEARELLQHARRILEEQAPNHPILRQLRAQAAADHMDGPCPCGSSKPFRHCHGALDDYQPG